MPEPILPKNGLGRFAFFEKKIILIKPLLRKNSFFHFRIHRYDLWLYMTTFSLGSFPRSGNPSSITPFRQRPRSCRYIRATSVRESTMHPRRWGPKRKRKPDRIGITRYCKIGPGYSRGFPFNLYSIKKDEF